MIKRNLQLSITLLTVVVCFTFMNCAGSKVLNPDYKLEKNPPFTIKEAYFLENPSDADKLKGEKINIVFLAINPDVEIQEIYFRDKVLPARSSAKTQNIQYAYLHDAKNLDIIMDSDPMKEAANTPSAIFPFQLKESEAVIGYTYKGKKKYHLLKNVFIAK